MSGRTDQSITRLCHWVNLLRLDLAPGQELDDFITNALSELRELQAEIKRIEGQA